MVASAFSPAPAIETTRPRPKVSWLTRSPAARSTTVAVRFPVGNGGGRSRPANRLGDERDELDELDELKAEATCRHSMSSSGISSRKREGGLKLGEPHVERADAREHA